MAKRKNIMTEWKSLIGDPKVNVHTSLNVELLYRLQKRTGDVFTFGVGQEPEAMMAEFFERGFKDVDYKDMCPYAGDDLLAVLPEFSPGLPIEILKSICSKPDKVNLQEIARTIGLAHGEGTWISNAEEFYKGDDDQQHDGYEPVAFRDEACRILEVFQHDEKNKHDRRVADNLSKIKYLFFEAQCYQYAIETVRLIYFYNKYPDLYLKMYNELMGGREISYGEK